MPEFVVTPWEVKGEIDYDRLIEMFGTQRIDDNLRGRIEKETGESHFMLRRNIFYSHRDMNLILDLYKKGTKFFLYTGRGPSGHTHVGHILPWVFCQYLQEKFGVKQYFQITDDEKFLFRDSLTLEETKNYGYENALDMIALGFKPELTKIMLDTEYIHNLYPLAIRVAKKITFSTAKSVFGFTNSNNIGSIFYTSIQSAPCFIESELSGVNTPCLIPCGIDQDPHFRVTRDIAEQLGYYKPALMHNKMMPSLTGPGTKMSASNPQSAIFTTDTGEVVTKKLKGAFTGGQSTIKEQKEMGGNPAICPVYSYSEMLFEPDDEKLAEIFNNCKAGKTMCGECKMMLIEKVNRFLKNHQEKREKARGELEKFLLRD